jgi:hypothetical protein
VATSAVSAARATLARTRIVRRRQRSMNTPANGPTIEYGSSSVANAAAVFPAVAWLSGENSTNDASATWNTPSAVCAVSRVA